MSRIKIFDTTLRDGEQSPGVNLNAVEKLEIARQLERLGVDRMEVGFPASSKGDFEAVKRIAETIKETSVAALSRSVQSDIDTAWEALKYAEDPCLHLFIATSPIHMEYKLKKHLKKLSKQLYERFPMQKNVFQKLNGPQKMLPGLI